MRIRTADDLGRYVRDRRLAAALTQTDLAVRARVSRRWLSDLEAGKPTAESRPSSGAPLKEAEAIVPKILDRLGK